MCSCWVFYLMKIILCKLQFCLHSGENTENIKKEKTELRRKNKTKRKKTNEKKGEKIENQERKDILGYSWVWGTFIKEGCWLQPKGLWQCFTAPAQPWLMRSQEAHRQMPPWHSIWQNVIPCFKEEVIKSRW